MPAWEQNMIRSSSNPGLAIVSRYHILVQRTNSGRISKTVDCTCSLDPSDVSLFQPSESISSVEISFLSYRAIQKLSENIFRCVRPYQMLTSVLSKIHMIHLHMHRYRFGLLFRGNHWPTNVFRVRRYVLFGFSTSNKVRNSSTSSLPVWSTIRVFVGVYHEIEEIVRSSHSSWVRC